MVTPERQGQRVAETLWRAAVYSGFPDTAGRLVHVPDAFKPKLTTALSLPIDNQRHPDQVVILVDGHQFDRSATTATSLKKAYVERPRTRVYENVARLNDGWIRETCLRLGAACNRQVTCSIYQSNAGDAAISPHDDEWFGISMQTAGAKDWIIATAAGDQPVRTLPGSLLVLPADIRHAVNTPADPGYSTHLSFGFHAKLPVKGLNT